MSLTPSSISDVSHTLKPWAEEKRTMITSLEREGLCRVSVDSARYCADSL